MAKIVTSRIAYIIAVIKRIGIKARQFWIQKIVRNRFGVKPLSGTGENLEQWLKTPFGQELLSEEQLLIDDALADLYGFHLMQLGISREVDLTQASTINHRFSFTSVMSSTVMKKQGDVFQKLSTQEDSHPINEKKLLAANADIEKIPLGAETIDVALLHHVLEFTENPHQLLREAARIIIPHGYIVIVGFNPFSWFGVCKQFGRWFTQKTQWRHHSLRLGRLVDWLSLLDFKTVSVEQGFYRWPINHPVIIEKTRWYERAAKKTRIPMGGFYVIVARKDVAAMTPIKPAWKKFNPIETFVSARPRTNVAETSRTSTTDDIKSTQKTFHNSSAKIIH